MLKFYIVASSAIVHNISRVENEKRLAIFFVEPNECLNDARTCNCHIHAFSRTASTKLAQLN